MKKVLFFILISASLLTTIWFKNGNIMGGVEDGLLFYNISNYYHQSEFTWMEYPGLGSPSLSIIAGKPTYFILSLIQKAGMPGYIIQAGVFWILLVSSGIGIYFLVKELFPNLPNKYYFLSIIFYWFNPISLVDVWNRFLLNYIFFFAILPLSTYLYIKGLRRQKYFFIFVLNIFLIPLSYEFSYIAFTVLYWIWLVLVTVYFAIFNKTKQVVIFSIKYFLLNLGLFILLHSFWIIPLAYLNISGGAAPTTDLFSNQSNQQLLDALSKSVGNLNGIFKLINPSFLSVDSLDWVKEYYSPLLYILQYFFMGSIIYFLIKNRKNKTIIFIGSLFISIIFLAKGNNLPFGEIYNLLYKKILILQVFRNPFEKFGFLLSLLSSILLAPSIFEVNNKFNKTKNTFFPVIFMSVLLFLGFPLYSTLVFTNKFPPTNDYTIGYQVKVPSYYNQVDNFLKNNGENFRYLGLPIKDEGITYKWEKGYAGAELTVPLFSNSGILLNTSVPFFDKLIPKIEETLFSNQNFSNLSNLMNVRFYLLRFDIDYSLRGMTDPQQIEKVLLEKEKNGEVKKVATFGKVEIWENEKWKDNTFYIGSKIIETKDYNDLSNLTKVDVLKGEVLLDESGLNKTKEITWQNNSKIEISYKKLNPTKYVIHVKNATKPFMLVFSELYNNGWKAIYSNGEKINNHLQVNVYGSGWVVNRLGEFDISIIYAPQKWMDLGEKISAAGLIITLCISFFLKRLKKND